MLSLSSLVAFIAGLAGGYYGRNLYPWVKAWLSKPTPTK